MWSLSIPISPSNAGTTTSETSSLNKKDFSGFTISICKGDYDHLPEAAFYMVGTIEEAIEKAEKMTKEAAA